jgi:hypothetical protein
VARPCRSEIITVEQELLNYLACILQTWTEIFGDSLELMRNLDRSTVKEVELRVPGYSQEDFHYLEDLFSRGKLFSKIKARNDRRHIWENLQKAKKLVPSLFSFFEDIKFDIYGRALTSKNCFNAVVNNGTRMIVLARNTEVNHKLLDATASSVKDSQSYNRPKKKVKGSGRLLMNE